MAIDLSILICSVTNRVRESLSNLIDILQPQLNDNVEVLISVDNKKRTVGEKRNDLLNQSSGNYVVFVDDDDIVEGDYIYNLISAQKENPDVICFGAIRYVNNVYDKEVKYGIQYRKDSEDQKYYYRVPNHLMCFKRDIAIQVPYPYKSLGEDAEWARNVLYKIKTQHTIDKVLYHYYFSPEKTETQK